MGAPSLLPVLRLFRHGHRPGRTIGFDLPKNFDSPYMARSITDFWKRWNVSLSLFVRMTRTFLSVGNRGDCGVLTRLNLMLVMLVGGLW